MTCLSSSRSARRVRITSDCAAGTGAAASKTSPATITTSTSSARAISTISPRTAVCSSMRDRPLSTLPTCQSAVCRILMWTALPGLKQNRGGGGPSDDSGRSGLLIENADSSGADEEAEHDEDDAPQQLAPGENDIDSGDHHDHRDE